MQQILAAAALVAVLALSWISLFQSFGLAAGFAIIGLLIAPFFIFGASLPAILRDSRMPLDRD